MIDDRLSNSLTSRGYQRVNSNAPGVYLFYQAQQNDLVIVSVIHAITGEEMTGEQYEHILVQIKERFRSSNPDKISLLSLILTQSLDKAKHLCLDATEDNHWIVDVNTNRLIIYETGTTDFMGLRDLIEQLLEEEQELSKQASYDKYKNQESIQHGIRSNVKIFTLINAVIIVLNVFAFLILHYTGAFGGERQMMAAGALSWYFVKVEKEFYRIVTSMFMHSDWSHLINNMIVLLFVGGNLERTAGKHKYLFLYFGTGIIAGITSISYNMWKDSAEFAFEDLTFSIGASGAIFGLVGAMLYIVIVNRGRIEDLSTRQMVLFIIFSLYGGLSNAQIDQAAHIGGFLAGMLLAAIIYRIPKRKSEDTIEEEL